MHVQCCCVCVVYGISPPGCGFLLCFGVVGGNIHSISGNRTLFKYRRGWGLGGVSYFAIRILRLVVQLLMRMHCLSAKWYYVGRVEFLDCSGWVAVGLLMGLVSGRFGGKRKFFRCVFRTWWFEFCPNGRKRSRRVGDSIVLFASYWVRRSDDFERGH